VYVTPELARLLAAQVARVEALGRHLEPARIIPYLFPHFTGTATRRPGTQGAVLGEQRTEFRKAWATACKAPGCPKITGHRTEAVYRRYTITSDADQRETAARLGTFLGTHPPGVRLKRVR